MVLTMHELLHVVWHALLDTLQIIPFLFLTYLAMELLEHKAGERVLRAVSGAGRAGPLIGASVGLLPQCGFSAAAAGFYAGRVVTLGTLLAVFLATSDEMIAVFVGEGLPLATILTVLAIKLAVGVSVGFLVDALLYKRKRDLHVGALCEAEGCHCEEGVLRSALHHTLHVVCFVFVINLVLGFLLYFVSAEVLAAWLNGVPVLKQAVAALVGLVPNCAVSVAIATLYARGVLSAGAMLSGLLTGAGVGLLVLFRTNKKRRENLAFVALLLAVGIAVGCLLDYTGLAAFFGL